MLVGVTFAEDTTMLSPDGNIKVSLTLDKDYPQFSLSFNGTEVLAACELKGFLLKARVLCQSAENNS